MTTNTSAAAGWRPACACHPSSLLPRLSRRSLLLGASGAALSACTAMPGVTGGPQIATGKIDVHHHFNAPGSVGGQPGWSAARAVAEMDANKVAVGVGYPGPVVSVPGAPEAARRRARELNEFGANVGRTHPGRFGLFASLPFNDTEGSLREIEYAFDVLKADGVGIATNYGPSWLGDARFVPVWEELNRRGAVVFVHPADAPCCTPDTLAYEKPPLSGPWIEWPMNTARTILDLMVQGRLRAYPRIRFIFCHGGGMMPAMIGRIEGFKGWFAIGQQKLDELFPNGIRAEFSKLWFECAQALAPENFEFVRKVVPDTQILFGSDFDRFSLSHAVNQFNELALPADTRAAVERGNAERLFPRLKMAS